MTGPGLLRNYYYLLFGFWKKPSSKKICIRLNQQFFKSYLCQDDLGFWHQNPCPKQNTDEVLHFYSVFDSIILTRSPKVIPLNCSKEDLMTSLSSYYFWHKMFAMCYKKMHSVLKSTKRCYTACFKGWNQRLLTFFSNTEQPRRGLWTPLAQMEIIPFRLGAGWS